MFLRFSRRDSLKQFFFASPSEQTATVKWFNFILIAGLLTFLFWSSFLTLDYEIHWENIIEYRYSLFQGFMNTILISFISLFLSLIIGVIFGLGQTSSFIPLKMLSRIYIEIIRGTPLLVQMLIFFYVVANAIHLNNRIVVGISVMSLFSGAYIAEIIRAGIQSIGETQWESARSIGLTPFQTYRFVIFPQVVTRTLPPLAGQLASLIKDSSLLSIIAIKEFTMAARELNANTFSTLEAYIPLAIGYLLLTLPISWISRKLEKVFYFNS